MLSRQWADGRGDGLPDVGASEFRSKVKVRARSGSEPPRSCSPRTMHHLGIESGSGSIGTHGMCTGESALP
jgi:hypothetical protein